MGLSCAGATVLTMEGSNQGAKMYSLAEITAATQNYNRKIGEGGFGPVYYGKLPSGKEVAVKVSDANSRQGVNEFNNEVSTAFYPELCHSYLPVIYSMEREDTIQNTMLVLVYEIQNLLSALPKPHL